MCVCVCAPILPAACALCFAAYSQWIISHVRSTVRHVIRLKWISFLCVCVTHNKPWVCSITLRWCDYVKLLKRWRDTGLGDEDEWGRGKGRSSALPRSRDGRSENWRQQTHQTVRLKRAPSVAVWADGLSAQMETLLWTSEAFDTDRVFFLQFSRILSLRHVNDFDHLDLKPCYLIRPKVKAHHSCPRKILCQYWPSFCRSRIEHILF